MRYLSLFSGIEAASVAFEPLGWAPVAFAEVDRAASDVLAFRWPGVPNLGDITKITTAQIKALGPIDLVIGGFPCQDVSIAGKRKGLKDVDGTLTRSGLFFEAMRLVRAASPRWLVIENVPGLFSSHGGRDFAAVVSEALGVQFDVPKCGWANSGIAAGEGGRLEWAELDAQFWGLAQRRERVFFVGYFGTDWSDFGPILLERESLCWDPAPRRKKGKDIAPTIAARTSAGGGLGTDFDLDGGLVEFPIAHGRSRVPVQDVRGDGGDGLVADVRMVQCGTGDVTHALRADGFDASEDGTGCGTPIVPVSVCPTLRAGGNATGGDRLPGTDVDTCDSLIPICYAIQERAVCENPDAGPDGIGVREGVAFTLEARSQVQAVAFGGNRQGGSIDVAAALNAKGGSGRMDFESETLIAFNARMDPVYSASDTGAIDTDQGTQAICFSSKDYGNDAACDMARNVGAMSHAASHANAGGQLAVAFALRGREGGATPEFEGEVCGADRAASGGSSRSYVAAFHENQRGELTLNDTAGSPKIGGGKPGQGYPAVQQDFAVRRLSVKECERLQGFSDNYTRIPIRTYAEKPIGAWFEKYPDQYDKNTDGTWTQFAADGPRYKQLGNSFPVPVVRWLGQRIEAVERARNPRPHTPLANSLTEA